VSISVLPCFRGEAFLRRSPPRAVGLPVGGVLSHFAAVVTPGNAPARVACCHAGVARVEPLPDGGVRIGALARMSDVAAAGTRILASSPANSPSFALGAARRRAALDGRPVVTESKYQHRGICSTRSRGE
jgi:hypothetical protein